MLSASSFVVKTGHRSLRVAIDGEVNRMQTPLTYRVRPRALKVIAPAPREPV